MREHAPPVSDKSVDTFPVVSTRYDPVRLQWALEQTGLSRAKLLARALDDYINKLLKEAR